MPSTTTRGFPYPLDSDPVADGAKATRDLAQKVDSALGVTAAGTVIVAVSASAIGSAPITFPAGRFSSAPILNATVAGTTLYFATISTPTTTGATINVRRFDNTAATVNVTVHWQAKLQ